MPFKPNYRFERIERERKKQAKKEERLKRRQENAASADADAAPESGREASSGEN